MEAEQTLLQSSSHHLPLSDQSNFWIWCSTQARL